MILTISGTALPSDLPLPSWLKVKSFSPSVDFLVSSTVRNPHYRKAVSLGIPIVHSSFLYALPSLGGEEEARREARHHLLPRFAGTSVYFAGFADGRFAITIGEYGGKVVHNPAEATHIVAAPEADIPAHTSGQFIVTAGWIRESLDLGWMANETSFEVSSKRNRLRRRSAKMLTRKFSKKNNPPPVETSGAQKYKRYQLCRELYVSEINCLKAIDFLIRINSEENFLTPAHTDVIFGSFPDQKKLHSELVAKLGKVLDGWNDCSQIGSIFVDLASQLEEAYVPYFQGLTASLDMFKECRAKNAKFRHYIKEKEKDRNIDKQKVEYLLNVPMQQITSRIGVTLKEVLTKTDASLADHVFIRAAIDVVDDVLRKCNNFKKESSESELIYRQVKNIPARILCSSRRFLSRCRFMCVQSPALNLPVAVELLLFEDVLMITRRTQSTNVSCATLGQKPRRAKFVDVYPMAGVREIQLRSRTGEPPLVELTLRRPEGDCEWQFELAQEMEETIKYLNQLVEQVDKVCCRQIFIRTISSSFCPKTPEASKITPSTFVRSLSSTSAFKNIRSYSQRLRLRRNISADVSASPGFGGGSHVPGNALTPKRPPLPKIPSPDGPSYSNRNSHIYPAQHHGQRYNERSVDVAPPRPQTPPSGSTQHWKQPCTPIIQEVDSEEDERVNPYEAVKYFSPLKNMSRTLRHPSVMDEWC